MRVYVFFHRDNQKQAAAEDEIDFMKLERKELIPPYKPQLRTPLDVSYFDPAFTEEPLKLTPVNQSTIQSVDQNQFKGFSLTNKLYTYS